MKQAFQIIFILITSGALAAPNKPTPGASKAIQAAREALVQKKDRKEAIKILSHALRQGDPAQSEIAKELENLAKVFLTDDGQKAFELAESLLYSANPGALAKYEEALTKEPDNLQVLLGSVRARIFRNECQSAESVMAKINEEYPAISGEPKFLQRRLNYCLKVPIKNPESAFTGELKRHGMLLWVQKLVEEEKLVEAQKLLDSKELDQWDMPEVNFWRYKAFGRDSGEAVEYAQKYISQCGSVTPALRRKFKLEPRLCMNLAEAEEFVKKSETTR